MEYRDRAEEIKVYSLGKSKKPMKDWQWEWTYQFGGGSWRMSSDALSSSDKSLSRS